jgi:hypothetical protein
MDKPPTKAKPSAEAEEAPDELDADAKAGAFDAEAKALDQRLRQLISDYAALFLRYPNVEGRPSVEVLEKMQVLATIRVHPWRKKLADEASKIERAAFGEGQHVFLQMWIDGIPEILERGDWDLDFAARNLITTLPAPLRVRCPRYPGTEDRDAFSAAAVAVASKIRDEVKDSKRCKDPDAITIGRLALEAMGYEGARHLRLLGPPKRRPRD